MLDFSRRENIAYIYTQSPKDYRPYPHLEVCNLGDFRLSLMGSQWCLSGTNETRQSVTTTKMLLIHSGRLPQAPYGSRTSGPLQSDASSKCARTILHPPYHARPQRPNLPSLEQIQQARPLDVR